MKYSANAGDSVNVQPAGIAGQEDRLVQGVVNESANAPICLWDASGVRQTETICTMCC